MSYQCLVFAGFIVSWLSEGVYVIERSDDGLTKGFGVYLVNLIALF